MTGVTLEPGQIWKEGDKRFERFVKIISVGEDVVMVRTCDENGVLKVGTRLSPSMRPRFGRSGGYLFIKAGDA